MVVAPVYRRMAALALLVAWLLPAFGAIAHSEGHAHRFCEEHGAFEESSARAIAPAPTDARRSSGSALGAAPSREAVPLGHLQCPVAHPASRDAAPFDAAPEIARAPLAAPAGSLQAHRPHAPVDVLAVAPKSSPPVS